MRVEHRGHLVGAEPEDVAQDEHRDLAGRQDLQRGHERQGDGSRSARSGPPGRAARRAAPSRRASGNGSSQTTSPSRVGSGGSTSGTSHALAGRRLGRAARVEAPVGGDAVEPGAERRAPLEPVEAPPGGQQRVLQRVLGVLERAEHPVAVHLQLAAVRLGQLPERVAVAGPRPGDQVGRVTPSSVTLLRRISYVLPVSTPAREPNRRSVAAHFSTSRCLHRRRSGIRTRRAADRRPSRRNPMLQDKVAVIYGAGGAIGGAVARAFAERRGQGVPHRAPRGTGRGGRAGHRLRRRSRRGGRGRRRRRAAPSTGTCSP